MIVVLADTLRADHLGAYGFPCSISPNLDELARRGVVFENAFAQAPWTKPSIASMMTGLYVQEHGVEDHEGRYGHAPLGAETAEMLPQRAVTLAERFRDLGYETGAFMANPWLTAEHGFAQGFDEYRAEYAAFEAPATPILEQASRWIDQRLHDGGFFAYIHLLDVHAPYNGEPEDFDVLRECGGLGGSKAAHFDRSAANRPQRNEVIEVPVHGEMTRRQGRLAYAAGVRALDRRLGSFFDYLEESEYFEDGVLVVTSDHGEELGERGDWGHGWTLFDEQLHVPLVVRVRAKWESRERVSRVVELVDLSTTLLRLAGDEEAFGHGTSLLQADRDEDFAGVAFAAGMKPAPSAFAARDSRYKSIVELLGDSRRVFDLDTDPAELHPLDELNREERAHVKLVLDHVRVFRRPTGWESSVAPVGEETRERLRALGYLE